VYTASCFYADLVVGGEEHGHGTSRRLEKILGSIATLLGYRTWYRDSRESRKISRNRNGKSIEVGGEPRLTKLLIEFILQPTRQCCYMRSLLSVGRPFAGYSNGRYISRIIAKICRETEEQEKDDVL
jgi:hypothetical protein